MSVARRQIRYGGKGRAITSPALLASSIQWRRSDTTTTRYPRTPVRLPPPPDPVIRPALDVIRIRSNSFSEQKTKNLIRKYLNDSKERILEASGCLSRRTTPSPARQHDLTSAKLSGSDIRIKWRVSSTSNGPATTSTSTVVQCAPPARMPVAGTSSRSGRLARISQSNIRPYGSGTYGNSLHSSAGGQPLPGQDPTSPTKKDFRHRFEIVKKLGSGTYGKVSLAFDHKFEREVAVKLIKKSAIENKEDLIRIRREIRIMSALNHPNIIQIFEVFENKDKIILVMEYASGGELYDYVSKFGSLPEPEARRIFRQITSAVLYCHKHKVAHRDLKLENILLDQDNNAKIADFGLSNYFSDKSLLSTFCGSPLYASPEIINGTPYKGPEVDCWSLGILLYTLVYGSMPFEGRDFNRMVRQIKRGAYYEPDTPSTASMLIRNMLRVNPERRADIFDIASHWWLNLEENMPVIQELPENQIIDHTPLTERAETMIVQDLADEADVFMEFGHLSSETRKKIEEFRRRRKEAENYIDNSPVKPPKARKTEGDTEVVEMTSEEKSLRGVKEPKEKESNDPLERLRQIESRLGRPQHQSSPKPTLSKVPQTAPPGKEIPANFRASHEVQPRKKETPVKVEQPEDPAPAKKESQRAPSFVPVSDASPPPSSRRGSTATSGIANYRIETDSLNMLMNQVLEQMDKGPVSLNMIARIKAHPLYETRPMVKELLESIIAAQPPAITSKIMQQQSQGVVGKKPPSTVGAAAPPPSARKPEVSTRKGAMGERPWHSVEVGFDPEDESEMEESMAQSTATEITVQDTSFEDSDDQNRPPMTAELRESQTQTIEDAETEDEEDEEYTDSEMEELADEVEKKVEKPVAEFIETLPPPDPSTAAMTSPQYLDAFDRGLIKRQSKGKYQHSRVDMYGRGVSMECESPSLTRKVLGGPQPTPEQSPFLFDKAKEIIMQYPKKPDSSLVEDNPRKKKKDLLNVNAEPPSGSVTPVSHVGSVPPRTPPPLKSDDESEEEEDEDEEEDESEEESEEEESETEVNIRPRGPIISAIRRDGEKVETTVAHLNGRKSSFMQSAPASIHASMSPEPKLSTEPNSNARYFVTVAELKVKPSTTVEPKPYSRVHIGDSNVANTKSTLEKKIAERENMLKEELRDVSADANSPEKVSEEDKECGGKESWESAAAYIRRKNRERRIRNLTIATPEEISRAVEKHSTRNGEASPGYPGGPLSPHTTAAGDQFYSHHTGASGASSLLNYVRPRYHDDLYTKKGEFQERPTSPTRYTAALNREERGKSFVHDNSPDRPDYRSNAYGVTDTRSYYSSAASPSYTRKFDHDWQPTSLQSWAAEPRKFEVYKTRAERDREMHTMHTTPTAATSYRPSSYYSGSDRPLSTYSYRPETSTHRPESTSHRSDAYSRPTSKYDEYPYRRDVLSSYDRAVTPGTEGSSYNSESASGYRPTARRVASALTDNDKRAYNRSRSMDRKQSSKDHDYGVQLRNRLTTPENGLASSDYTYVNYHDSSNGRVSQSRDDKSSQPRSILKNKQSIEQEPRSSVDGNSGNGRGLDGGIGPVRSVIDRLRRHLSLEKSSSPQRQLVATTPQTTAGQRAPSVGANPRESLNLNGISEESPKKKRSLLSFNRRRTSEVRLGSDGKLITNGFDDTHSNQRPTSPIDKIKALFRKSDMTSQPSSHAASDYYSANRYSNTANGDKYGGYPTSNVASSRDSYVPQYRKYPGVSSRDPATALNRYSYTPGLTDQRRHRYDDHNMY